MTALPGAAQSPPVVQPSAPLTCKHHYNIEYIELFDLSGASISFSWSRVRSGPWRRWGTIVRMRQLLFPIHYPLLRLQLSPAASWRSLGIDYPAHNHLRSLDTLEKLILWNILLRRKKMQLWLSFYDAALSLSVALTRRFVAGFICRDDRRSDVVEWTTMR